MRISDWSSDVCSSDLHGPQGRSASRPYLSGEDGMGRGSENLLLARASRTSAVGALRRVPCLADYTGGRLSFGNDRAAPLVFPRAARAMRGRRGRRAADLRTARSAERRVGTECGRTGRSRWGTEQKKKKK